MNENKLRSLGWWQPFGTLMLPPYNKIETRKVLKGKKPPFPLGMYLIYTTLKPASHLDVREWCGDHRCDNILRATHRDKTRSLYGYAIGIGELASVRLMNIADENACFVLFDNHLYREKDQWCLVFKNVKRIEPFEYAFGKQGVGFVPDSEIKKIKYP